MSTIIHKEKFLISSDISKTYPDNWEDENWIPVPPALEHKLFELFPDCEFVFDKNKTSLIDIKEFTKEVIDPIHYPTKIESIYNFAKFVIPSYITTL